MPAAVAVEVCGGSWSSDCASGGTRREAKDGFLEHGASALIEAVAEEEAMTTFSDDLDRAVMAAMWPLPRVLPTLMLTERDLPELESARAGCKRWREWLKTADLDKPTLNAYLHWVEFCEKDNDAAAKEIATGEMRKVFERYEQDRKAENERVAQIKVKRPEWKR